MSERPRTFVGRCTAALTVIVVAIACSARAADAQRLLFVSNDGSSHPSLSVFAIGSSGGLSAVTGSPFLSAASCCGADAVALSPNGHLVYMATPSALVGFAVGAGGSLSALPGSPHADGHVPVGLAMPPNGRYLYATNAGGASVSAFSITANGALAELKGSPFALGPAQTGPGEPAITTNGRFLYVPDNQGVVAFVLHPGGGLSEAQGSPYRLPGGLQVPSAGVTPNGRELLVGMGYGAHAVAAYSITPSGTLRAISGSPFSTAPFLGGVADMAVSPTGRALYVVGTNKLGGMSIGLHGRLAALPSSPYTYPAPSMSVPQAVAVAPGGANVFASDPATDTAAAFAVGKSGALTLTGPPVPTGDAAPDQFGVTASPDQSPTASFRSTRAASGKPTTFNGSSSTAAAGKLARYAWRFGDRSTAVTVGPRASHVYVRPGTYTVTLTVADDEGCSNALVFTGQTLSCNGSARAQTRRTIVVPPGPAGATTLGAKRIRTTGATVTGRVSSNGRATTYFFQYGQGKRYGQHTKTIRIGAGAVNKRVTAKLKGLSPKHMYHYRLVARNRLGIAMGSDRTFKTR